MKALIYTLVGIFAMNVAIAQEPLKSTVLSNGDIRVEGKDALGGYVAVVYDRNMVKKYQERTVNGETTYVQFANGNIVEYGTYYRPAYTSTQVEFTTETSEP